MSFTSNRPPLEMCSALHWTQYRWTERFAMHLGKQAFNCTTCPSSADSRMFASLGCARRLPADQRRPEQAGAITKCVYGYLKASVSTPHSVYDALYNTRADIRDSCRRRFPSPEESFKRWRSIQLLQSDPYDRGACQVH